MNPAMNPQTPKQSLFHKIKQKSEAISVQDNSQNLGLRLKVDKQDDDISNQLKKVQQLEFSSKEQVDRFKWGSLMKQSFQDLKYADNKEILRPYMSDMDGTPLNQSED